MASSTGRRLLIFITSKPILKQNMCLSIRTNRVVLLKGKTWKWIFITFVGKSQIFEQGNMGFNVIILLSDSGLMYCCCVHISYIHNIF